MQQYSSPRTLTRGQGPPSSNTPNANIPGNRDSGIGAAFLSGDVDEEEDDNDYPPIPARRIPNTFPLNTAAGRQQRPSPLYTSTATTKSHESSPPITDQRPLINQSRDGNFSQPQAQSTPRPLRAAFIPKSSSPSAMTPHPLQAPKTPISPVFARPALSAVQRPGVKFSDDAILRGNSEETLLSRSTPKGADFWRRFSMVVKEEDHPTKAGHRSSWLAKHETRASRMRGCVWVVSIALLLAIGGVAALVWFFTHNSPALVPKALSGGVSSNATLSSSSTFSPQSSSTSSPLHTVAGDLPPTATVAIPTGVSNPGNSGVKRDAIFPHLRSGALHRQHGKHRRVQ